MAQIFPRFANETPRLMVWATLLSLCGVVFAFYWWASPYNTDVGYAPDQPVAYSHALHAGTLEVDCRYCHSTVERSPHAGVPATEVCMNCHAQVKKDSPKLTAVRESWADGKGEKSIPWKRIHKLADFAFFDHSAHVGVGVGENRAAIGCETCHGRIDTMEVVSQQEPLSMSWCLECHSDPAKNLRPVAEVTAMGWKGDLAWKAKADAIAATLNPPGSLSGALLATAGGGFTTHATAGCSGCHR